MVDTKTVNATMVYVYGSKNCPKCNMVKILLNKNNYPFQYFGIDEDKKRHKEFIDRVSKEPKASIMTVPQIWVNDEYIENGYQGLVKYINNHKNKVITKEGSAKKET